MINISLSRTLIRAFKSHDVLHEIVQKISPEAAGSAPYNADAVLTLYLAIRFIVWGELTCILRTV